MQGCVHRGAEGSLQSSILSTGGCSSPLRPRAPSFCSTLPAQTSPASRWPAWAASAAPSGRSPTCYWVGCWGVSSEAEGATRQLRCQVPLPDHSLRSRFAGTDRAGKPTHVLCCCRRRGPRLLQCAGGAALRRHCGARVGRHRLLPGRSRGFRAVHRGADGLCHVWRAGTGARGGCRVRWHGVGTAKEQLRHQFCRRARFLATKSGVVTAARERAAQARP